jgi:hypothetical protein
MPTRTHLRRNSTAMAQMECLRWKRITTSCSTVSFCTAVVTSTAQRADQNRTEECAAALDSTQESMKATNATIQRHQNSMWMGTPRDGFCHASGRIVRKLPKGERQQNMVLMKTVSQSPARLVSQGRRWIMVPELA